MKKWLKSTSLVKKKAFNGLVGQVMKASKGKANPAQVNELMKKIDWLISLVNSRKSLDLSGLFYILMKHPSTKECAFF